MNRPNRYPITLDNGAALSDFRAAANAMECSDPESAVEYAAIAILRVVQHRDGKLILPGYPLLYVTEEFARCAALPVCERCGEAAPEGATECTECREKDERDRESDAAVYRNATNY